MNLTVLALFFLQAMQASPLVENDFVRVFKNSAPCAAAADYARGCDGNPSGRPNNSRDAVAGGEPRFTIAVDHDCCFEHTCCSDGRNSQQQGKETR